MIYQKSAGTGVLRAGFGGLQAEARIQVVDNDVARQASFRADVVPLLSKAGCNMGACHGNLSGKGGFRLSLRGEDPDFDYAAMTRDQLGRRIDRMEPGRSLIVLKPTGGLRTRRWPAIHAPLDRGHGPDPMDRGGCPR